MTDQKFHFWRKCFTYANVMTIGVGLLVAFAGNSIFFEMHNDYTQKIFFDDNGFPEGALKMKNFLFGIIGGTIVGFHVLMVMISEYALKEKQQWAYRAAWYGMMSWFVIDSSLSIYWGAVHNVILINIVALVLIGIPLLMMRKVFIEKMDSFNKQKTQKTNSLTDN